MAWARLKVRVRVQARVTTRVRVRFTSHMTRPLRRIERAWDRLPDTVRIGGRSRGGVLVGVGGMIRVRGVARVRLSSQMKI